MQSSKREIPLRWGSVVASERIHNIFESLFALPDSLWPAVEGYIPVDDITLAWTTIDLQYAIGNETA